MHYYPFDTPDPATTALVQGDKWVALHADTAALYVRSYYDENPFLSPLQARQSYHPHCGGYRDEGALAIIRAFEFIGTHAPGCSVRYDILTPNKRDNLLSDL